MIGALIFAAFVATVPAANWMIGNVGAVCVPDGPCLIPVGFGLMAPSGVLMIGLALVLRDALQEALGVRWAVVAILLGTALSVAVAPPSLVIASGAAFLFAELADLAVYTPLRKRGLGLAVMASGLVGSVLDSGIFLLLAFGSLDYLTGNVVGKVWMTLIAATAIWSLAAYQAKRDGE